MIRKHGAGRRRAAALLPLAATLLAWAALGCRSTGERRAVGAGGLLEGPTRWLMLPEEEKEVRRLRTPREAVAFVETFWRKRDPDPDSPGNELSKSFYERVAAADRLYTERGVRGSLTERGRALILLGPPPVLRYGQKKVPLWEPGRPGSKPAVRTREMVTETWVYPLPDAAPRLAAWLAESGEEPGPEIVLVFAVEPRRTYLIDGETYLQAAVRAAVRN